MEDEGCDGAVTAMGLSPTGSGSRDSFLDYGFMEKTVDSKRVYVLFDSNSLRIRASYREGETLKIADLGCGTLTETDIGIIEDYLVAVKKMMVKARVDRNRTKKKSPRKRR